MTCDFSSIFSLKSTLQVAMYDYEDNNKEDALQQFFDSATDTIPIPHNISFAHVYEGSQSVLQFVRWFYATTPSVSIDDCTDALYECLHDNISYSETAIIDIPTIQKVLEAVDKLFPFSEKIFGNQPLSISIIDAEMSGRNGESVAIIDDSSIRGAIFLYRIWNNFDGRFTPATVLIHELGHMLHIHITGELNQVPKSFFDHLESIGADYIGLSEIDLLEVFADTFLLAVVYKTKSFDDPFPEITDATKQLCYNYITMLFNAFS